MSVTRATRARAKPEYWASTSKSDAAWRPLNAMNSTLRTRQLVALTLLASALLAACGGSSDGINEASALAVSVGGPTAQPGGAVPSPPSDGAKTSLDVRSPLPDAPTTLGNSETTAGAPLPSS